MAISFGGLSSVVLGAESACNTVVYNMDDPAGKPACTPTPTPSAKPKAKLARKPAPKPACVSCPAVNLDEIEERLDAIDNTLKNQGEKIDGIDSSVGGISTKLEEIYKALGKLPELAKNLADIASLLPVLIGTVVIGLLALIALGLFQLLTGRNVLEVLRNEHEAQTPHRQSVEDRLAAILERMGGAAIREPEPDAEPDAEPEPDGNG